MNKITILLLGLGIVFTSGCTPKSSCKTCSAEVKTSSYSCGQQNKECDSCCKNEKMAKYSNSCQKAMEK
jgi:hypothetical protein